MSIFVLGVYVRTKELIFELVAAILRDLALVVLVVDEEVEIDNCGGGNGLSSDTRRGLDNSVINSPC